MFELNNPQLDWITVSTYNPAVYQTWSRNMRQEGDMMLLKSSKWLQYQGEKHLSRDGVIFVGEGVQADRKTKKDRPHFVAWASGPAAGDLFVWSAQAIKYGYARVTRLDMQLTVEYWRETWSQRQLELALAEASPGMSVSHIESMSGPQGASLGTVYYGSRQSDRVVRIYEKMGMGDDVHLRFEVELKGERSRVVARKLVEGVSGVGGLLKAEIARLPDVYGLHSTFLPPLSDHDAYPVKLVKPESATVKWLREQVAPALDRVLGDHDIATDDLEQLFWDILTDHRKRKGDIDTNAG